MATPGLLGLERPDLVPKGRVLLPTGPVFPFALPLTPRAPSEGRGLCPGHPVGTEASAPGPASRLSGTGKSLFAVSHFLMKLEAALSDYKKMGN